MIWFEQLSGYLYWLVSFWAIWPYSWLDNIQETLVKLDVTLSNREIGGPTLTFLGWEKWKFKREIEIANKVTKNMISNQKEIQSLPLILMLANIDLFRGVCSAALAYMHILFLFD